MECVPIPFKHVSYCFGNSSAKNFTSKVCDLLNFKMGEWPHVGDDVKSLCLKEFPSKSETNSSQLKIIQA